jgi:hypothetical protein
MLIDAGYSYAILPWVGVIGAILSTAVSAVSWARERRAAALTSPA